VASFDKVIPPGGKGKIHIRIKTTRYQGAVRKSIRVFTNDPAFGRITLTLQAHVNVPIMLSPKYVSLRGEADQPVSKVAIVRAELEKPLKITPVEFDLKGKVTYSIEEVEKNRKFKIRFTSVPGSPQTYQGFLRLKTNYVEQPQISIKVRGRFFDPTDSNKGSEKP